MEVSDIICTIKHIQIETTTLHSNTFFLEILYVKSSTQNPTGHTRLFFPGSFLNPKYVCTWRFRWIVLFKIVTYHRRRWVDLKPLELWLGRHLLPFWHVHSQTAENSHDQQDFQLGMAKTSPNYSSIVSSRSISKHIAAIAVICLVHAWLPGSIICCLFFVSFPM